MQKENLLTNIFLLLPRKKTIPKEMFVLTVP